MAKDCWCTARVHLPGEHKKHKKALEKAKKLLDLAEGIKAKDK